MPKTELINPSSKPVYDAWRAANVAEEDVAYTATEAVQDMAAHNITETLNSMKESTQFSLDSMKASTDASITALKDSLQFSLDSMKASTNASITALKDSMQASFAGQQESINTLRTEIHSQKSQSWVLLGIFGAAVLSAVAGGFVFLLKTLNVV